MFSQPGLEECAVLAMSALDCGSVVAHPYLRQNGRNSFMTLSFWLLVKYTDVQT
jgi:hypothetical protein